MKNLLTISVILFLVGFAIFVIILTSGGNFTFNPRGQLGTLSGSGSGSGSGLITHFTFDDTVNDSAGSNNGTVNGNPTYVEGKMGKALSFDGDDYVSIPSLGSLTDFTISGWVKLGPGAVNRENGNNAFFRTSPGNRLLLRPNGYYIEFTDGAFFQSTHTESNINNWVHIALVKTSNGMT